MTKYQLVMLFVQSAGFLAAAAAYGSDFDEDRAREIASEAPIPQTYFDSIELGDVTIVDAKNFLRAVAKYALKVIGDKS